MNRITDTVDLSCCSESFDATPGTASYIINQAPKLSVVIPVYGAAGGLRLLFQRLSQVLRGLGESYEIVFVEDCSPDRSWQEIEEICKEDAINVRAIKLSRNFGQQVAITAGLSHARGEWAVVMDCDLQDPPEEIPNLYAKALEGFDLVLARRKTRNHAPLRTLFSKLYFSLLNKLTGASIDSSIGSFSIISRQVIDGYLRFSDCNRQYVLMLSWLGFNRGYIEYDHAARSAGKSSYNLNALVRLALQGIYFQSTVFLEWIVTVGLVISSIGFFFAVFAVLQYFLCSTVLPGWTSIVVALLLMGGVNLLAVGVVGLYVGQTFEQSKGRPIFVVQKHLNEPNEKSADNFCQ